MTKFKFLRKRSDYYRHFTVLDIGTDLIKVLVVRREGLDGEVLGVGREPQAPAAMSGGAIADIESVIQSCNRALEAAEDMAKTVPGQVVVVPVVLQGLAARVVSDGIRCGVVLAA